VYVCISVFDSKKGVIYILPHSRRILNDSKFWVFDKTPESPEEGEII